MRFIYLAFVFFPLQIFAQHAQKTLAIKFTDTAPKIDAVLDDIAWQNANIATDFVMFAPESGTPAPKNLKTEVKMVYDNEAVYFSAYLYNDNPDEIPMEFQTRDNFGNADFFGVTLNPQNDGINQTLFFVMSTGSQNDGKRLPNGQEDWSWNAVWSSQVKVVDNGWIVEIKIPYSALRFSNEKVQTWGINFARQNQKTRNTYSWNYIPLEKGSFAQYDGIVTGIKNIKPPIRLSFSPYASSKLTEYKGNYDFGWNVGMDLKYGISESFTLDATLIPDFGQVSYDNEELNLGPFEQKFSEKRQFFTEGLDLFSKGGFFYTRRVGNRPIGRNNLEINANEKILENPTKVDMINALKVSGRTKKGLAIGVFNAITKKTEAEILNLDNNQIRKTTTEPLANYNVFIIDQQFNQNSSVSLINTSVLRRGDFRDANVTGLLFNLKTKNSKYGARGGVAMSNIFENKEVVSGYEAVFKIGKINGKHQFDTGFSFRDKKYNKNDLGYQRKNNFLNLESSYSYRIFKPKGIFNNYGFYLWANTSFLHKLNQNTPSYKERSNRYTGSIIGISSWARTKKHLSFGGNLNLEIGKQYDYYTPNAANRFYKENPSASIRGWLSTDYRKSLALNSNISFKSKINDAQNYISISIAPMYRINNHIKLRYKTRVSKSNNKKGYIKAINDDIIFGNRDVLTLENSFSTKYNFNTKSSLGLNFRHYWSAVDYDNHFYRLQYDGLLTDNSYTENEDLNVNIWNFDLSYSWEFAPGSQLSILYRNAINSHGDNPKIAFIKNLENMFDEALSNQLSFKLIYYLDYNQLKI